MKRLSHYLNPISRLGNHEYSFIFPFVITIAVCVLSEVYAYLIAGDANVVGVYAILLFVALIIYFAFRDGISGGFITATITISYYAYIIVTRHYHGVQLTAGIQTTIILAILYFLVVAIIGGLKQKIDTLIGREADEKRRLQAIVEQLPVGILITDSKGKLTHRNKQIDTILGIKIPIGFTIGKDTLENNKIDGKSIDPSQAPLAHALLTHRSIVGKEYLFERADHKKIYVQVSACPIQNYKGRIIAAASIISDVTQQKEMELRKDDFVNMASHELKTPITSLKLYVDLLQHHFNKNKDIQTDKILTNIIYQTDRLQELVNELLDVSRLQTGKISFTKERFNITTLLKEIVDGLQGGAKKHSVLFHQKMNIFIYADKFRLYQVVTNLITNAIKYSPENTKIIVHVKRIAGKVIISVQDLGIGIAKDQQKKIFDRLYQVTQDKGKQFPGFGMGLYISKEIIKRHKGAIWVESEKGKGSTFFVSLPIPPKKQI